MTAGPGNGATRLIEPLAAGRPAMLKELSRELVERAGAAAGRDLSAAGRGGPPARGAPAAPPGRAGRGRHTSSTHDVSSSALRTVVVASSPQAALRMMRPGAWLHGKDLDVWQSEPTGSGNAGNLKTLASQHRLKFGRCGGAATAHPGNPGIAARAAAKDVPEHDHPCWAEHSGDLGDASRQVCPVAERQGGEHQIEHGAGEGQTLGSSLDVPDRQPGRSRRDGARDHPPGQVNADQLGRWIARSCSAKQPARATANVQNTACPGQKPQTKLQGPLMNGNEQELLQHTVLVGARPKVESARGWTWAAHESALMVGGR